MKLSEELHYRGFVNQTTLKDISVLDDAQLSFYFGVDPSSDSMTVGNLASAMMVRHFIAAGHKAVILVGGATSYIGGDPDGKNESRPLKALEEVAHNKAAIAEQYKLVFAGLPFTLVDNYDWFQGLSYLDFLRDIGNHVPMSQMLGRDFVQSRLEGNGINYAEFSYALIQGYDFVHLNREHGVTLQVCGADQWGNSLAGVELLRRIDGVEAHVYSVPLMINKATGKKFGKSEDGAIWLDAKKTSVYKFYQFWLGSDDEGVLDYLKVYTLLSKEELETVMAQFEQNRGERLAQKTLAFEVTKLVHGEQNANNVRHITAVLFGGGTYADLSSEEFSLLQNELPVYENTSESTSFDELLIALVATGLAASKSEARRFVQSGAIYWNGEKLIEAEQYSDFIGNFAIIRRGKNLNALIKRV